MAAPAGGEDHERARAVRLAMVPADRGEPARDVVGERLSAEVLARGKVPARDVVPEVAHEPLVRTEGDPPHGGVHAVGADNEIERAWSAVREGHVDSRGSLGERRDRVAEHVLGAVATVLVEHPREVRPRHLDVPSGELAGEAQQLPTSIVDEGDRRTAGCHPAEVGQDAHPLEHGQVGVAPKVDGVASSP